MLLDGMFDFEIIVASTRKYVNSGPTADTSEGVYLLINTFSSHMIKTRFITARQTSYFIFRK